MSADDWTAAALLALADGGIAAVAVEPLAARLGTTKGSFYWHFRNRDALLAAALDRWERAETEDVIAYLDAEPDLRRRLRRGLVVAIGGTPGEPAGSPVELALQSAAAHPLVAPALARVGHRRVTYLEALFAGLGMPPGPARRRALMVYTAYLGYAQLVRSTPALAPDDLDAYTDELVATLTAPVDDS